MKRTLVLILFIQTIICFLITICALAYFTNGLISWIANDLANNGHNYGWPLYPFVIGLIISFVFLIPLILVSIMLAFLLKKNNSGCKTVLFKRLLIVSYVLASVFAVWISSLLLIAIVHGIFADLINSFVIISMLLTISLYPVSLCLGAFKIYNDSLSINQ